MRVERVIVGGLLAMSCAVAACGRPEIDPVAGRYVVAGSWEIARPDGTSESGAVSGATIELGEVRGGHAAMKFVGVCGDTEKCSPFTLDARVTGHEGDGTVFDVEGTIRLPAGAFLSESDGDGDGNAAVDDASIKVDLLAQAQDGRVFRASFVGGIEPPAR